MDDDQLKMDIKAAVEPRPNDARRVNSVVTCAAKPPEKRVFARHAADESRPAPKRRRRDNWKERQALGLAPRPLLHLPPRHLRRRPLRSRISLRSGMLLRRASRVLRSSMLIICSTTHLPQFEVF